jgi:hypothetical protein
MGINWLAVLVAAIAAFVLGGIWYGPLFGKMWLQASGMTAEKVKQGNAAMIYGISFVLTAVAAAVLSRFIGAGAGPGAGAAAGFGIGAALVSTMLGVFYQFEHRPAAHWLVNGAYATAAFTLMGAIIGVWP